MHLPRNSPVLLLILCKSILIDVANFIHCLPEKVFLHFCSDEYDRYDKFCPFYKSVWMMRNIIHFYNLANQVKCLFHLSPSRILIGNSNVCMSVVGWFCELMDQCGKDHAYIGHDFMSSVVDLQPVCGF